MIKPEQYAAVVRKAVSDHVDSAGLAFTVLAATQAFVDFVPASIPRDRVWLALVTNALLEAEQVVGAERLESAITRAREMWQKLREEKPSQTVAVDDP